jgi:maltose-binding protein MalE
MKNFKSSMVQATFIIATIIGTSSCTTSKPEGSKEVVQRINEQTFENNNNSKRDAQFLVDAAAINREEISVGQ